MMATVQIPTPTSPEIIEQRIPLPGLTSPTSTTSSNGNVTITNHHPHSVPYLTQRGIKTNGWKIIGTKGPILNSLELDSLATTIKLPSLPEMLFGHSKLQLSHEQSGFSFELNAIDALKCVDCSESGAEKVQVKYSKEWRRKSATVHESITNVIKPYDWTFTTTYTGTTSTTPATTFHPSTDTYIPFNKLISRDETIQFYDEIILYEDELADNGIAMLSVKIRVMESWFLVLMRFFLRVDDVVFRVMDTRVFHVFGSNEVLKEVVVREAPYDLMSQQLPKSNDVATGESPDITLLTDQNWVSSHLFPPQPFFNADMAANSEINFESAAKVVNGEIVLVKEDEKTQSEGEENLQKVKVTMRKEKVILS